VKICKKIKSRFGGEKKMCGVFVVNLLVRNDINK
jgi:hypothetical protein